MPAGSDGHRTPDVDSVPGVETSTRERPLYLPRGRKLRHLSGIALRNLTTSEQKAQFPRPHGKSIDEDASGEGPGGRLRRRSTRGNPLGLESPMTRQKRLEDVTAGRMADVFFSLHGPASQEPIYVSEVVSKSMNPNFQSFELSRCGPSVSRLDSVTAKIWAGTQGRFQLILELDAALSALQYIVFFLSDGVYTTFLDAAPVLDAATPAAGPLMPTASYDAIMKANTLEDCIQDAEETTTQISKQISEILERESRPMSLIRETSQARECQKTVRQYLTSERRRLDAAVRHRASLKQSLAARREAMSIGRENQRTGEKYLQEAAIKLERCRKDLAETRIGLEGQRRRIIGELQEIYPVESIPDEPLGFTIRGLQLPNDGLEDHDPDAIAAALGYVAHVVYLLAFYLGTYLRYPVQHMSSTSFIRDPISVIAGARTFPLWLRGSVSFRFEYAVFLLNKDVEQLMSSQSLWVMDIRHTLPNLKYLLLYITSGNDPM